MGLKEQIVYLDRSLRKAKCVKPAGSADKSVLKTIDNKRMQAFGHYMAEKIFQRFYLERFGATLLGCARVLHGDKATPLQAVQELLKSESFEQTIGEDKTGSGLFGWFCANKDKWPDWLIEVASYEYIVHIAFLLRDQTSEYDLAANAQIESVLCDPMQVFEPFSDVPKVGEIVSCGRFIIKQFDYPARELQEVLECHGSFEVDVVPEPYAALWVHTEQGIIELEAIYPHVDILQFCERPQKREALEQLFGADETAQAIEDLMSIGALKIGE